jgi:hypothetical protein
VIQELDPEQPALSVEVQDDVSDAHHGILDDVLAERAAISDVGQIQIAGVNLGVPSQTEGHFLVTLTRRLRQADARRELTAPPHSRRLTPGLPFSQTGAPTWVMPPTLFAAAPTSPKAAH